MSEKNWQDQFKIFELQDEIDGLKSKNRRLEKKNRHFQSTKAYKVWQKYASLKDKPQNQTKKAKSLKSIKVAMISDEFTFNSFKHEFKAIPLTPKNWKKQFEKKKPDIFFCESAWAGYDGKTDKRHWKGKIFKKYDTENRTELLEILEHCHENSIPTVFWNKEDPPYYRAEEYSFAETAKLFDYIFTSSEECIKHYKADFNHPNVNALMFAGQPSLFNPLNLSGEKIEEVVFAGSYYVKHPERCALMDMIFDKIIEQWGGLMIFDRIYYEKWTQFPERFTKYTVPPITYEETAEVYKKMDWGLNINTVTDSNTMFARRVFELSLCYVNILTNYSKGVDKIFGDNVFVFDEIDKLPDFNNPYTEKRLNNLYNVLENHTYTQRWMQILDTMGFEYSVPKMDVTMIYKLSDVNDIEDIIARFERIDYDDKVLAILLEDKAIKDDIKEKYPQIDKVFKTKNQARNGIKTKFWMVCDMDIDDDFIRHAMLHYTYIHDRVSITPSDDKFKLSVESGYENKLVSRKNRSYLTGKDLEVYTYTI